MAKFDINKTKGINKVLNAVQQVQNVNNIMPYAEAKELPIEAIFPSAENFYPISDLDELSNSIREWGLLQPLLVSEKGGMYEIIAGNRRYEAAKMAGLTRLPCVVKQNVEPALFKIMLIHANMFRDKTDIDRAMEVAELKQAIQWLKSTDKSLKGRTNEIAGQILNLSDRQIARLDNLNKLIPEIQQLVQTEQLTASCAEQFANLAEEAQREIYTALTATGMRINRQEATRIKEAWTSSPAPDAKAPETDQTVLSEKRELAKVKQALVTALQERQSMEERYHALEQRVEAYSEKAEAVEKPPAEQVLRAVKRKVHLQECIMQLKQLNRTYAAYIQLYQSDIPARPSAEERDLLNELSQMMQTLTGLVTAEIPVRDTENVSMPL